MSRISPLIAIVLSLFMLAAACGSDNTTDVSTASDGDAPAQSANDGADGDASAQSANDGADGDAPIPVEPDGGIGDGAEPLPGAEEPEDTGTWHGAQVADTNCPGMEWVRVQTSAFSFSVPADFVDNEVQGIDSEVGQWSSSAGIQVSYDFGWYSYSLAEADGAQVEDIDYSDVLGQFAVVRSTEADAETNSVGIYFPEVTFANEVWDKLGLIVTHTDPNDEIIGRCIVRSVEWG